MLFAFGWLLQIQRAKSGSKAFGDYLVVSRRQKQNESTPGSPATLIWMSFFYNSESATCWLSRSDLLQSARSWHWGICQGNIQQLCISRRNPIRDSEHDNEECKVEGNICTLLTCLFHKIDVIWPFRMGKVSENMYATFVHITCNTVLHPKLTLCFQEAHIT
jgi:hypothetical protein